MGVGNANKLPKPCGLRKVEATEDQWMIFSLKWPVNLILIQLSPETWETWN
jgi:hypothetical protein